jgi:hypothetical protein
MSTDLKKNELNIALGQHFLEIKKHYLEAEINIEKEIIKRKNEKKNPENDIENTTNSESQ